MITTAVDHGGAREGSLLVRFCVLRELLASPCACWGESRYVHVIPFAFAVFSYGCSLDQPL